MNTVKIKNAGVKMIAHRGLSGIERENTNAAFLAAGNRSYFGIETDVHITKDGKFVVIHDETTRRVTLGQENISVEENEYSAVETILLPDLDGSRDRKDLKIPLLKEYLQICKKYEKICVLEVKRPMTKRDLERLVEEIKQEDYLKKVIFISFHLNNCLELRKMLPENEIQWLLYDRELTEKTIDILCENYLDADIHYKSLTKKMVKRLHKKGIKVNCWTCDDKDEGERLVKIGVDFITSNLLE